MGLLERARDWDFDVDEYTCRYLPPSPLHRLPKPVSRFLGFREVQRQDVGNVLGAWWSCLGAICGLAVVAAVFNNTESIQLHAPPALIASFGASAILEYNAIRSPLGQPRNALLGHTFSALVGVGITKLFLYHSEFERIRWIAGAVACGIASAVMLLTGTVHPPGGASAVLAATAPEITAMGWYFVGLVMWGTTLMLLVALVINNIQRQFPVYWWTPLNLREIHTRNEDIETVLDVQGAAQRKCSQQDEKDEKGTVRERGSEVVISAFRISLPEDLPLNREEARLLESLQDRLRKRMDGEEGLDRVPSSRPSTEVTMVQRRSDGEGSDTSVSVLQA
ncbi:HPP family protein [Massariosphaeria phaeospora]|uniref:HPP family protein n=1 Tax=Massariosphaeria phaeospora TaxID=100035 RepID=A0A7C8M8J0_9PLEO|nr:HPP family protein [Massariosphaeria phaeospora]